VNEIIGGKRTDGLFAGAAWLKITTDLDAE
jgi:hypothetical protein